MDTYFPIQLQINFKSFGDISAIMCIFYLIFEINFLSSKSYGESYYIKSKKYQ